MLLKYKFYRYMYCLSFKCTCISPNCDLQRSFLLIYPIFHNTFTWKKYAFNYNFYWSCLFIWINWKGRCLSINLSLKCDGMINGNSYLSFYSIVIKYLYDRVIFKVCLRPRSAFQRGEASERWLENIAISARINVIKDFTIESSSVCQLVMYWSNIFIILNFFFFSILQMSLIISKLKWKLITL